MKAQLGRVQGYRSNDREAQNGQDEMRDMVRKLGRPVAYISYSDKVDSIWGDRKDDRPLPCEICNKAAGSCVGAKRHEARQRIKPTHLIDRACG